MQWIRWLTGRVGITQSYDILSLDLKSEWLEEAKQLPDNKIIIDSTFPFEDVKQSYQRLNTGRARGKIIVEVSK